MGSRLDALKTLETGSGYANNIAVTSALKLIRFLDVFIEHLNHLLINAAPNSEITIYQVEVEDSVTRIRKNCFNLVVLDVKFYLKSLSIIS